MTNELLQYAFLQNSKSRITCLHNDQYLMIVIFTDSACLCCQIICKKLIYLQTDPVLLLFVYLFIATNGAQSKLRTYKL